MNAFQLLRIASVFLLAALCSCGIQPRRIEAGTTVAVSDQIPVVLQTILDYDESGGRVPFFSRFDHAKDQQRAPASLLKSVQIVVSDTGSHAETWVVDVNGQIKSFTVTFFHGPGGNPFGADGCWVRYIDLVKAEVPSFADYESEAVHRFAQPKVREKFKSYMDKNYSFSKTFGIVMPKVFAYSHGGAWGIGISGLQDWARRFALQECEAIRQPSESKCLIVNIDGKWTR